MIRLTKSDSVPASLKTTAAYSGEDVRGQLKKDQHSKCYLCERTLVTDFQIEHYKSQRNFPDLKSDWNNLFLSCGYCNQKKSDDFDDLIDPLEENVEEVISQRIDYFSMTAVFESLEKDGKYDSTLKLLNALFNGKNGIRKIKEQSFFNYLLSVMNRFLQIVNQFLQNPDELNGEQVRGELDINQEFLGFKYWIIKDNPILMKHFGKDIIWNKK